MQDLIEYPIEDGSTSPDMSGPTLSGSIGMQRASFPMDGDYSTIDEARAGFAALEEALRAANDRRAIFVGAYLTITSAMGEAIEAGEFIDAAWARSYLLHFARLYIEAFRAFENGDLEHVPIAWRVAFELSARGEGMALQHLLLGVNAHINHDLAIALMRSGIDPDRPMRYDDHTGVNQVLKRTVNALQDHVERYYSPALHYFDEIFGHWDEEFSCLMVDRARETAWTHCLDLVDCSCEEDEAVVIRRIDDHAGALARVIAAPHASPLNLYMAVRTCF
ncbi:MAG: DUF5995 family protein [Chloroflexota bacterium]